MLLDISPDALTVNRLVRMLAGRVVRIVSSMRRMRLSHRVIRDRMESALLTLLTSFAARATAVAQTAFNTPPTPLPQYHPELPPQRCLSHTLSGHQCNRDATGPWTVCSTHLAYFTRHRRLPAGGAYVPTPRPILLKTHICVCITCGSPHAITAPMPEEYEGLSSGDDSDWNDSTIWTDAEEYANLLRRGAHDDSTRAHDDSTPGASGSASPQ